MAEPGDPSNPDDHDDLIGFASPAALAGRLREPPVASPEPLPEPSPSHASGPGPEREQALPGPTLDSEPVVSGSQVRATPRPDADASPLQAARRTDEDRSVFEPSNEFSTRARRRKVPPALPGGGMGLFAVYALILFAVPTGGVSAVIGLLAVTGRAAPEDPVSHSHFVYQQRTLWAAVVATLAGIILLVAATFALGVPTLFILACWMVLRGASGVWALKAGQPVANPRGWWI